MIHLKIIKITTIHRLKSQNLVIFFRIMIKGCKFLPRKYLERQSLIYVKRKWITNGQLLKIIIKIFFSMDMILDIKA